MPAPGDQHRVTSATANPFEEPENHVSMYTAEQVATLQARLNRFLGPEYISGRDGPGGRKVHYIAAVQCIQLANEIFGFNGWSSTIKEVQVDYVEEIPNTGKFNMAVSVIMRVTLKDGTYHEDIGYGMVENCKSKAMGFEKTKKEATTDALKRALRNFGNVLGNCIYDKDYVAKVTKIKTKPPKFDIDNLHRHADYAPVKLETTVPSTVNASLAPDPKPLKTEEASLSNTKIAVEDDFDAADFDDVDFSMADEAHPDEVVVDETTASHHFTNDNLSSNRKATNLQRIISPSKQSPAQAQPRPIPRLAQQTPNLPPQIQSASTSERIPQTHGGPAPAGKPPPAVLHHSAKNMSAPQGSKMEPPSMNKVESGNSTFSGPGSIVNAPSVPAFGSTNPPMAPADASNATPLFFSARAASMLQAPNASGSPSVAVFNPHAESPSIRKTAGVDHTKSMKLWRETDPTKETSQIVNLAPKSIQSNVEGVRRIGMPPSAASPMANRSTYKPPLKRTLEGGSLQGPPRPPLNDVTTSASNGSVSNTVPDPKRPRVDGEAASRITN